jgi:hypothetical protein
MFLYLNDNSCDNINFFIERQYYERKKRSMNFNFKFRKMSNRSVNIQWVLDLRYKDDYFESISTIFEANFIFQVAGEVAKIFSSVKSSH